MFSLGLWSLHLKDSNLFFISLDFLLKVLDNLTDIHEWFCCVLNPDFFFFEGNQELWLTDVGLFGLERQKGEEGWRGREGEEGERQEKGGKRKGWREGGREYKLISQMVMIWNCRLLCLLPCLEPDRTRIIFI